MEQTAVEWLYDQMNNIKGSSISMNGRVQFIEKELNNLFKQAKSMEKEQIVEAVDCCLSSIQLSEDKNSFIALSAEQYYNERFVLKNI